MLGPAGETICASLAQFDIFVASSTNNAIWLDDLGVWVSFEITFAFCKRSAAFSWLWAINNVVHLVNKYSKIIEYT